MPCAEYSYSGNCGLLIVPLTNSAVFLRYRKEPDNAA